MWRRAKQVMWRRASALRSPSTFVSVAIIAAVAAMVVVANWRDARRAHAASTRPSMLGVRGVGTGRDDLARRLVDRRSRILGLCRDAGPQVD